MSDTRRAPINTAAQDPMLHLAEALDAHDRTGHAYNAILEQEAQGQQSLVHSDTLPTRRNDFGDINSQEVLEAAGVKFGAEVPGDSLFRYVDLPQGWKKVSAGHSMWSNLLDERGRVRASIFYKAAFYDRDAFYSASRRYSTRVDYERRDTEGITVALVIDGDTVIYTTDPVTEGDKYELAEKAQNIASQWLDENFPDWKDPKAYWN